MNFFAKKKNAQESQKIEDPKNLALGSMQLTFKPKYISQADWIIRLTTFRESRFSEFLRKPSDIDRALPEVAEELRNTDHLINIVLGNPLKITKPEFDSLIRYLNESEVDAIKSSHSGGSAYDINLAKTTMMVAHSQIAGSQIEREELYKTFSNIMPIIKISNQIAHSHRDGAKRESKWNRDFDEASRALKKMLMVENGNEVLGAVDKQLLSVAIYNAKIRLIIGEALSDRFSSLKNSELTDKLYSHEISAGMGDAVKLQNVDKLLALVEFGNNLDLTYMRRFQVKNAKAPADRLTFKMDLPIEEIDKSFLRKYIREVKTSTEHLFVGVKGATNEQVYSLYTNIKMCDKMLGIIDGKEVSFDKGAYHLIETLNVIEDNLIGKINELKKLIEVERANKADEKDVLADASIADRKREHDFHFTAGTEIFRFKGALISKIYSRIPDDASWLRLVEILTNMVNLYGDHSKDPRLTPKMMEQNAKTDATAKKLLSKIYRGEDQIFTIKEMHAFAAKLFGWKVSLNDDEDALSMSPESPKAYEIDSLFALAYIEPSL